MTSTAWSLTPPPQRHQPFQPINPENCIISRTSTMDPAETIQMAQMHRRHLHYAHETYPHDESEPADWSGSPVEGAVHLGCGGDVPPQSTGDEQGFAASARDVRRRVIDPYTERLRDHRVPGSSNANLARFCLESTLCCTATASIEQWPRTWSTCPAQTTRPQSLADRCSAASSISLLRRHSTCWYGTTTWTWIRVALIWSSPESSRLRRSCARCLFEEPFVCVVPDDHPASSHLDLATYLQCEHMVVQVRSGRQTMVDDPLRAIGVHRKSGTRSVLHRRVGSRRRHRPGCHPAIAHRRHAAARNPRSRKAHADQAVPLLHGLASSTRLGSDEPVAEGDRPRSRHVKLMCTALVSVKLSNSATHSSRPRPEDFHPPNGVPA